MPNNQTLSVCGLSVGYPGRTVLDDISFTLNKGQTAVLIGSNGSGKSTLLRTLSGLSAPLEGKIEICGNDIAGLPSRHLAELRSIVSTQRYGGGAMTVREAVAVGRFATAGFMGRLDSKDRRRVEEAIELTAIESLADRYLGQLSDGEKQKVMLARAIVQQTPLMILDEPTAFLDVAARVDVLNLLRRLADMGKTIILSTHDIAPAIAEADVLMIVDKEQRKLYTGQKEVILADGIIDRAFAGSGLRFDRSVNDFR